MNIILGSLDLTSFIEMLIGSIKSKEISFIFYIILFALVVIFFAFKDLILVKKQDRKKEAKQIRISKFLVNIVMSLGISCVSFFVIENLLISYALGIIATLYYSPKIIEASNKKKEEKKDDKNKDTIPASINNENNQQVSVVVNNNMNKEENKKLIPDFYEPGDLKMPDDVTSFNQLNIIMILEMYGYISPNHKFKMITQSLFETPDDQVNKLLAMYVLDEKELKEAKAILNLIKLNNKLITKEEALQCISDVESKMNG